MAEESDFITLIDDDDAAPPVSSLPGWKVAIIDDDPAVHDGSRFALQDYTLNGRGLQLLSARSTAEAHTLLSEHDDIAVILLDVVMETESAGLDLVDHIRKELGNEIVRIILRTGQPGQAPEQRIVVDYDINDYKAKTELTAEKLFTALTAALRSYEQLQRLDATRRGLEIIIEAAASLFDFRSLQRLAEGVLMQLASLLAVECAGILVLREEGRTGLSVLAGSGSYSQFAVTEDTTLDEELQELIHEAFARRGHQFDIGRYVLYIGTGGRREVVVVLDAAKQLSDTDRSLVQVFCSRLSAAFDNVTLYEELQQANAELEERVHRRTQELIAANERLETRWQTMRQVNAFKNEVLGTVAHDLKNPLGVILGRTEILDELLAAEPPALDNAGAQVAHIRVSARRLTDMVDTLIRDAMADALDINVRREPVDLVRLAEGVAETNRATAGAKSQSVSVEAPAALRLVGDPDRLREAIDNLVSNAVKYTPIGGAIVVGVERRGHEAHVRVVDTGPGLSPEDAARLFGRFQRLSAKPTGGESSTGLGLSIVKRIADLHGGRVAARNRSPEAGAEFTLILPMAPAPEDRP